MTYREGEADAARRMPDLTAPPAATTVKATGTDDRGRSVSAGSPPPGAQHQAQHARNISVHSDSSSFVMNARDGDDGDECKPPKPLPVSTEMCDNSSKSLNAPGRTRTSDLRFRKPSLYPLSYGRKSFE